MLPTIATDEIAFARDLLMVVDKQRQLVPLHYNRAQQHYLQHRTGRDLILKARQLGFSTCIQAEFFRLATTGAEATLTMADKDENTAKLRRIANRFYDNLPPRLPKPIRSEDNASVTIYPVIGSEVAIATAGSKTSGRASSYTRFHGSEVAYWKDAEWVISGALQSVPEHADTWIVFESSANGTQGWFYEECMKALEGLSEWSLHFYAWWWDDDYRIALESGETLEYDEDETALVQAHNLTPEQIKWRRKKQAQLGATFQQEYPESPELAFLTSGRGVFDTTVPTLFYDRSQAPAELIKDHTYVMGVDWGQYPDPTAACVIDADDYQEVALLRTGARDYDAIVQDVAELALLWRVGYIVPEFNSIGRFAVTRLAATIQTVAADVVAADERPYNPVIKAFETTNKRKDDLVKLFQQGILDGLSLLDDPVGRHELRIFQASQTGTGLWTYAAPNGEHDDTVIARLLAHLATYQFRNRV